MPGAIFRAPIYDPGPTDKYQVQSFGVVYANEPARNTVASTSPLFPTGSIIVREKLARADSDKPELLAVMIKREAGFNRKAGDWEFLILSGDMKKVRHREKKGDCQRCHSSEAKQDFVFRQYLPQ